MITDSKIWHCFAEKKLPALFRGIASNHVGDCYCLNCFHSYRTKRKLRRHENAYANHDYCYIEMPKEDNEILKYNHEEKSIRTPFDIYADRECFLKKQILVIIILKSHQQLKQINLHFLVIRYLYIVYLMKQKSNLIIIEAKII